MEAAAAGRADSGGVRVAADPLGHGSCLLATRSFAPGEVVLREDPAHVLAEPPQSLRPELLQAVVTASGMPPEAEMARRIASILDLWLRSSGAERTQLRTMFGVADGPMAEFIGELVGSVQKEHSALAGCSAADLSHVVLVWLLSAHTTDEGSAIFTIGHRCNHSCLPNVAYAPAGNTLVFRALRTIQSGEPIHSAYLIGRELLAPRRVRQRLLASRKSFDCRCLRCKTEHDGAEPGRALPCACGGQTRRVGPGSWRCDACASKAPPTAQVLEQEEALVDAALSSALTAASVDNVDRWKGHWAAAAARWTDALEKLRGGVERGDKERARRAFPLVVDYFAWVEDQWPSARFFVSAQAAEVFACLSAMGSAEAAVIASRVCSRYLAALEHEFGVDDADNVRMRAFIRGHCGQCGQKSSSCCSRCQLVSYCSRDCQKKDWKTHKKVCKTLIC